ncbi:hypothetical protein L227DRAFT_282650 [Lentinus tigrinus ALCF2SS1-6]|uniref:Uncharacterized protein n=1 Tax=Lentinus tigrinus ALCF2SS1-6 TaxID=1328759 RepID=A0A5C2RZ43_9APHY|nr:hypothetical protein L227DRAFT_282650 [Lentinus tigrinus ALCF2SS1-6]
MEVAGSGIRLTGAGSGNPLGVPRKVIGTNETSSRVSAHPRGWKQYASNGVVINVPYAFTHIQPPIPLRPVNAPCIPDLELAKLQTSAYDADFVDMFCYLGDDLFFYRLWDIRIIRLDHETTKAVACAGAEHRHVHELGELHHVVSEFGGLYVQVAKGGKKDRLLQQQVAHDVERDRAAVLRRFPHNGLELDNGRKMRKECRPEGVTVEEVDIERGYRG